MLLFDLVAVLMFAVYALAKISRGEVVRLVIEGTSSLAIAGVYVFLVIFLCALLFDIIPTKRKRIFSWAKTNLLLPIGITLMGFLALQGMYLLTHDEISTAILLVLSVSLYATISFYTTLSERITRKIDALFGCEPLTYISCHDDGVEFRYAVNKDYTLHYTEFQDRLKKLDNGEWVPDND